MPFRTGQHPVANVSADDKADSARPAMNPTPTVIRDRPNAVHIFAKHGPQVPLLDVRVLAGEMPAR